MPPKKKPEEAPKKPGSGTVSFQLKSQYGKRRFYPLNEEAHRLCALIKVESLSREQLGECQAIGLKVELLTPVSLDDFKEEPEGSEE